MPGATGVELKFADGDYLFRLNIPQILELERSRQAGILELYGRVLTGRSLCGEGGLDDVLAIPHQGRAFWMDAQETIRLALIGGGKGMVNGEEVAVSALRARELVDTYLAPPAPFKETWNLAASILYVLIEGYEDKKKAPAASPAKPARSRKRKSSSTAQ